MVGHSFQNYDGVYAGFSASYSCSLTLRISFKDDFQFVLRSLRTLMFVNIINGSLDGMQINVIR